MRNIQYLFLSMILYKISISYMYTCICICIWHACYPFGNDKSRNLSSLPGTMPSCRRCREALSDVTPGRWCWMGTRGRRVFHWTIGDHCGCGLVV